MTLDVISRWHDKKFSISQIHLRKALKSCGVLTAATISSISATSLMRAHTHRQTHTSDQALLYPEEYKH